MRMFTKVDAQKGDGCLNTEDWLMPGDLVGTQLIRKWVIAVATVIVLLGYLREWLRLDFGIEGTSFINLNQEQNIGAWFSTILLASCAFLLLTIGRRAVRLNEKYSRFWFFLAFVFVALSLDEASSVHEMVMVPLHSVLHTDGLLRYVWVLPALFLVPAFAITSIPFLLSLRRPYGLWIFISGAVFVAGALGMEMLEGLTDGTGITFVIFYLIEETLEIAGTVSFLFALMSYLSNNRYLGTK